jgi:hypothetical protein
MVTLMTVGYGDEVPVTSEGKLVACVAMLASVLLLALPISVIGTEFTQQWLEYKKHSGVEGPKRKLAPKFLELKDQLKAGGKALVRHSFPSPLDPVCAPVQTPKVCA